MKDHQNPLENGPVAPPDPDFNALKETQQAPEMREIKIKLPKTIPDEVFKTAMNMGMTIMQMAQQGLGC